MSYKEEMEEFQKRHPYMGTVMEYKKYIGLIDECITEKVSI